MADTSEESSGANENSAEDAPKTDYVITGDETEIEKSERLEAEAEAKETEEEENSDDDDDAEDEDLEDDDDTDDDDDSADEDDDDQDDDDGEEEQTDEDESDKGKKKRRGGFQKKIDKLNAVIEGLQDQIADKSYGRKVDPFAPEPERQAFRTDREFDDAHMDWRVDQREAGRQEEAKKEDFKTSQKVKVLRYEAKTEELRKNSKYAKAVDSYDGPLTVGMQQALIDSEYGPEIALKIAKSPKLGKRLAKMPVLALNKQIGRMEARIEDGNTLKVTKSVKSKSKTKKKSSAPSPIKPVKEASNKVIDKDNESYEDHLKRRQRRRGQ